MPYVTKSCLSWFNYLEKNINFSLIMSNRIIIFGICIPCKVLIPSRLDFNLISWISEWLSFGGQVNFSDTLSNRSSI